MGTITRTGTFYGVWHIPALAHIDKCQYVILIAVLTVLIIEISTKKGACVIFVEYIKTDNIPAICILALQVSIGVVVR